MIHLSWFLAGQVFLRQPKEDLASSGIAIFRVVAIDGVTGAPEWSDARSLKSVGS